MKKRLTYNLMYVILAHMKFKALTQEEFLQKAKEKHGDRYDYSLSKYKKVNIEVEIICEKHGVFNQKPMKHFLGHGCPLCGIEKNTKRQTFTTEIFIENSKKIHGNKYDYSLVDYVNAHVKVKIICQKHGIFEQLPMQHVKGAGCPKCAGKFLTIDEFIEKCVAVHGDLYDYSCVKNFSKNNKIKVKCKKHNSFFKVTSNNHLRGSGCPLCKSSKSEIIIRKFLENNNIKFEEQKKFNNCKTKRKLPFDFYLIDYDLLIEYQGSHHYNFINFYHKNKKNFEYQKLRDQIKWQFAKDNNINLLEIPYWEHENIESILKKELKL